MTDIDRQAYRDGTHQENRLLQELHPDYVAVDERSFQDWLSFAQNYGAHLKYFNESDEVTGDWSAFLNSLDIKEIVDFFEDPTSFQVSEPEPANLSEEDKARREAREKKYRALSQPHLILFLTFLKLLEYPQQQFRDLTPRYLEHYYKKVLRLTEKPEIPNQAHVAFTLAAGYREQLLEKGTLLNAGKDSQGTDLNYAINEDLIVNQAQVASIKTLAVEKAPTTTSAEGETEVRTLYATTLEDAAGNSATSPKRFKPFQPQNIEDKPDVAAIGFAIASPLLSLNEGERVITLTLACKAETFDREKLKAIFETEIPFEFYLSTADQWLKIENKFNGDQSIVCNVGDFLVGSSVETYESLSLDESEGILIATGGTFEKTSGTEELIQWSQDNREKLYKVNEVSSSENNSQAIRVEEVRQQNSNQNAQFYSAYLHCLQFKLTLDPFQSAIVPLKPENTETAISTPYPVLKVLLKPLDNPADASRPVLAYEAFKDIVLEKVNIHVTVQGIKSLHVRNDISVLNAKGLFEPFGNRPQPGSGFYIANSEVSAKPLKNLSIRLEWMGLPNNFSSHYKDYGNPTLSQGNRSFKAQMRLLTNRSLVNIGEPQSLFASNNESNTGELKAENELSYQAFNLQNYTFEPAALDTEADDPLNWPRYIKLELESPDFGHDLYPIALTKAASDRTKTVHPPYTPKVKSISLNYTALDEIDLVQTARSITSGQVFQLHPFGYRALVGRQALLPQLDHEGYLFIGLRHLYPPQDVSLLFQMIAGSANTDLETPELHWSYLSGDTWQDFKPTEILSDSTNGFVDAGIVRLTIPAVATNTHQLMPSGLHWVRVAVNKNGTAIPDTLDIKTQAVSVTYVNQGNAADHLSKPLAANSIQALRQRVPTIQSVSQPYSSFKGKRQEDSRAFNTRVSERLRHKQRAIMPWDYEHMVLERFPEIYKVKCIRTQTPGSSEVTVVVVPDIRSVAPFFPLEPKAPLYLLKEIETYLKAYSSPFVQLKVKNPRYERIRYRIGVRFRSGYEQGYYLKQINQELKRFLSPWAYGNQTDLAFGNSIHSSSVINFLEKLPYVDYISNFKLIEQVSVNEGRHRSESPHSLNSENDLAQVHYPDAILVSASEHFVDVISTIQYEEVYFQGIGYMKIGFDFVVSEER